MISKSDTGDMFEARVAQLWFWEGFFSRSAVNVQRFFTGELVQVTDLDLLAYSFDPSLIPRRIIGEVKSGTSKNAPKALDRAIWLHGLSHFVGADRAELVLAKPTNLRTRELAETLNVGVHSLSDIERREKFGDVISLQNSGSHGVDLLGRRAEVRTAAAANPALDKAFNYVRSEVWFADPWTATKRTINLLRLVQKSWTPKFEGDDAAAIRWILAEGVSALALNMTMLSSYALAYTNGDFAALVSERLAEGPAPAHAMGKLSDAIDKYVADILTKADAPGHIKSAAVGAFQPRTPDFAQPLSELLSRFAEAPKAASKLPRIVDFVAWETLVRGRQPLANGLRALDADQDVFRLLRSMMAFMRSQCDFPDELASEVSDVTMPFSAPTAEALLPEGERDEARDSDGQLRLPQNS